MKRLLLVAIIVAAPFAGAHAAEARGGAALCASHRLTTVVYIPAGPSRGCLCRIEPLLMPPYWERCGR